MHVVARCDSRKFSFTTREDFELLLAHLRELVRTYGVTLYAYILMSNHVHLLLQAPPQDALGRPLRWFMAENARAFHHARGRRGHFWVWRSRACLVEEDTYAFAALRYLRKDTGHLSVLDKDSLVNQRVLKPGDGEDPRQNSLPSGKRRRHTGRLTQDHAVQLTPEGRFAFMRG